jgi:hypothetical protein
VWKFGGVTSYKGDTGSGHFLPTLVLTEIFFISNIIRSVITGGKLSPPPHFVPNNM